MNTRISRIYYLVPLFYLAAACILLFFEYTGREHNFNYQINTLKFSGSGEPGLKNQNLSDARLTVPGLTMNLSRNSVTAVGDEGVRKLLKVTGYELADSGVILSFDDDLIMEIDSDESGNVDFRMTYPGDGTSILLPFEPDADFHQVSFLPCYSFSVSGSRYILKTGKGSLFDQTAGALTIPAADSNLLVELNVIGEEDPVKYYFFGDQGPVSDDSFESAIENYVDNSYAGWRDGRYRSDSGTWLLSDGTYGLDNNLLSSFISENLKRGRYALISSIVESVSEQESDFSFLSAPFTGNIVNTDIDRQSFDDELKKKIASAVRTGDLSVFLVKDLYRELKWISSSALMRDFLKFVSSIDLNGDVPSEILVGMAEVYRDWELTDSGTNQEIMRLYSVIEERIYPSLARVNGGLFLTGENESVIRTELSLRAGLAVYEIGKIEADELLESVGKTMVASVLMLTDGAGKLPESLNRDGSASTDYYYGGDIYYSYLVPNEYYPHVVNFNETAGQDIEIWTVADDVRFQSNSSSMTFEFSMPRGVVHHLVIKGIEPFKSLTMNGINWNSDRRFQYYSSGWVYDEDVKSLYIKLTQRNAGEKVILFY